MAKTRIHSQDVGDTQIQTADLADDSVTKDKLAIITTKGDLLSYTTEPVRVGVGTNDQIPVADSTQAAGWRWGDAPAIPGAFATTGDIAPPTITASVNDYNPTGLSGASVVRLVSDAVWSITGLAGGADGRRIVLVNIGSFDLTLVGDSASSAAGNRFGMNGASFFLAPRHAIELLYDATATRWRMIALSRADVAMTTQGDLLTFSTIPIRLARGSAHQYLATNATSSLEWRTLLPSTAVDTNGIVFVNGTAALDLPIKGLAANNMTALGLVNHVANSDFIDDFQVIAPVLGSVLVANATPAWAAVARPADGYVLATTSTSTAFKSLLGTTGAGGVTVDYDNTSITWSIEDVNLLAFSSLAGTGLVVHTGAATYAERTITAGVGTLLTNGSGVAGNPTVDLTINALTTETALATGDLFAIQDVSVGTTPAAQRKVTLGNVAAGLNTLGTLDHGLLTGLTDDDHVGYARLVGRSGGQVLIGGTATGDDLILESTSHATKGDIDLKDKLLLRTSLATISNSQSAAAFSKALTFDNLSSEFTVIAVNGTWTSSTGFLNVHRIFNVDPTLTNSAGTIIPSLQTLNHGPTYTVTVAATAIADVGYNYAPTLGVTGAGTNTNTTLTAIRSVATVGSGSTAATRVGLSHGTASGAGTVTSDIAVSVGALTAATAIGLDCGAFTGATVSAAVRSAITSSGTSKFCVQETGGAPSSFVGSLIRSYSPTSQTIPTESFVHHAGALQLTGTQAFTLVGTALLLIH